jgi:hypothetical protein
MVDMSKHRYKQGQEQKPDDDYTYEHRIKELHAIWRLTRDMILFLVGVGGVIYEAIWAHPVNQPILVIFAAMMGLPAFLRVDGS